MKTQQRSIIDFMGMEFMREDRSSMRLRKRVQKMRRMKEDEKLAHNVRGIFSGFFN